MATLGAWFDELEARKINLKEAEDNGWRDCIPAERETLQEFEYAFSKMLVDNMDQLKEKAGGLDVGEPDIGIGFFYSKNNE